MSLILTVLLSVAIAQESGMGVFAGEVVRRIRAASGEAVVFLTAEPGRSCKPAFDAIGMLLAETEPLHVVAEGLSSWTDFLRGPRTGRSQFHKFAETHRGRGTVMILAPPHEQERITGKIGRLLNDGLDREGWTAIETKGLSYIFETHAQARFDAKHTVRDLTRYIYANAHFGGCTYHFITRADLAEIDGPACELNVSVVPSAWVRADLAPGHDLEAGSPIN